MDQSLVFHSGSELLEGPVFDKENNYLYFVSILDCLVYCYNPITKEILSIKLDSPVSCVFLLERKIILASSKNGFFKIDFNELKKEFIFQIEMENLNLDSIISCAMKEAEIEIAKDQIRAEGKPEEMVEKIAMGKLNKFYKDATLLNQEFVKDSSKSVAQMLNDIEKGLTVSAFKRVVLGA